MTRVLNKGIFRKYKPDSKALPPLLNKKKERKRLISIAKELTKLEQEQKRIKNLKDV